LADTPTSYSTSSTWLDARAMREDGFDHGESGLRQFAEAYGVLEKVTTIEASENSCSKARVSTTIKRRPGASPLLFGKYLMNMAAFVSARRHLGRTAQLSGRGDFG
jgi:hypothetical protein